MCEGNCNDNKDCDCGLQSKPVAEHTKIRSRTTGRLIEIPMAPSDGGRVSKNPFASLAQEGYLHAHPAKLGAAKLAEFDAATKGKKLPKRAK